MSQLDSQDIIDFPGTPTVVVRVTDYPVAEMPQFMDPAFTALGEAIAAGVFVPVGPAFSRHEYVPTETASFEVGFPVTAPLHEPVTFRDYEVVPSELPAGRIAIAKHRGGYHSLGDSWGAFMQWVEQQGLTAGLPFWEAYDTEPTPDMNPDDLITGLAVPVS
ncbi:GyrI-like domain-containing protein [Gulosibacter sediminis]|uniref:GyrI-like domain-containing protein n=1 Tax=Gulosibacter sediminis TaxID=1729695 RepID=UPI0024ADEA09|nr:GyrI-like domain-containing protein [Gulosibacter sediminis]